ncbi:low-density lipoprotein receptor-related protein 4-like isoform X2 [Pomacea canaliculata]|uniref:low-density lipoprotein receptor-related protein 4-like isoform X2 n=1 Tax=Pomacea canaliculata TaxID=400727 RepID=UPI000D738AD6|nr:low-density lipoprotein receptor-related protein 4-like isoform X2 [Pomacea canaliculata]
MQTSAQGREAFTSYVIPQKFLLFTASEPPNIFRRELDIFSWISISTPGLQDPDAIDYDQQESRIYWTDRAEKTIRSASIDGSDVRLDRNLSSASVPDGLCVDALSRLIFYTDAGNKVIGMITMYSNTHRIVINSSLDMPKDIELDKHNGVMYWSDRGATPTIERANYDGTGRQTLVSGGEYLNQPNAIALDTVVGRLYWADGGTQKVGWVDLKGTSTSVILTVKGSLFYDMDIYQNQLFISDWHYGFSNKNWSVIHRYGANGTKQDDVTWYRGRFNGVHVYAEETEDKGPNGCGNNGGCSYICIPTPGNRSKCLTDGTESTTASSDDTTTDSTPTSRDLVTSSSTGVKSATTKSVIIIVVCVVGGVLVVTVVVVLVVVFKLRRKSNCTHDVAYTRRGTTPDIPLEPPSAVYSSAFDVVDNIYCMARPGKSGDNSNDAGGRNCVQPKTFTKNNLVPQIVMDQQAFTANEVYVDAASVEEPCYANFGSIHVTDESSCQQPLTSTNGKLLPSLANREQATAPSDCYSNLGYEEENVYENFHSITKQSE